MRVCRSGSVLPIVSKIFEKLLHKQMSLGVEYFLSPYLCGYRKGLAHSRHCYRYPAGIYLFKVNNRNTRTRCEICSKLTINTPERRHWRRSGVFIVNFEHISHLVLVFLLLTLNK